jgi:phosphotriesterase-related protein
MKNDPKVITVKGPIAPAQLGLTLTHEHLLVDQSFFMGSSPPQEEFKKRYGESPVRLDNLWLLKRDPYACRDDVVIQDTDLVARELKDFGERGGKAVVDVTDIGLGRNPQGLRRISEISGLHIITSTGFYVEPGHPSFVRQASLEELADLMFRELTEGIENTGIRAGFIGEIGTSMELTAQEEKVLRAAARAQIKTGAAMNIHLATMKGREGPKVLGILEKEGADLRRVVLSHMDFVIEDYNHQKGLVKRGAFLEFDSFGMDFSIDSKGFVPPREFDKVRGLKRLIDDGFIQQLLISHDICFKIALKAYGGQGFDHIFRNVFPLMKSIGIDEESIRQIMVGNPARLLAF